MSTSAEQSLEIEPGSLAGSLPGPAPIWAGSMNPRRKPVTTA